MGKKFMSDSPTLEEIMRFKNRHTTTVDILLDSTLAAEIKNLERQEIIEMRVDTKENRAPKAPAVRKQIEALVDSASEVTATFTFQDLGRKRFEGLIDSCPPTDEQKEEGYQWDPNEFGPAIIAASSLEPKLTTEDAQKIYDEWSAAEAEMLVMTAINANMGVSSIPFTGTGTVETPNSELSLITAPIKESPIPTT